MIEMIGAPGAIRTPDPQIRSLNQPVDLIETRSKSSRKNAISLANFLPLFLVVAAFLQEQEGGGNHV
ncbi:MAG: hypothetical protein AAGI12_08035 [Pseudomonadota bacterium]